MARASLFTPHDRIDNSGDVYDSSLDDELTLTNAKPQIGRVMIDPNGGGDSGWSGKFTVPDGYDSGGTTEIVIRYILDGAPGSATVAFIFRRLALDDSESVDQAYGDFLASNNTWTGYVDEDIVEETIGLTEADYAAGDDVFFFLGIDDSVHTRTTPIIIVGAWFQNTAA